MSNTQIAYAGSDKTIIGVSAANPLPVLSSNQVWNGTAFESARTIVNSSNSTGIGVQAVGLMAQFDDVSITSTTENLFGNVRMSQDHILYVAPTGSASAGAGISSAQTTVAAATLVVKASAGNLYEVSAYNGSGAAAWLMVFNATSAPADGTVTPFRVFYLPINGSVSFSWNVPPRLGTGISMAMSSAGPYTKTAVTTGIFMAASYM